MEEEVDEFSFEIPDEIEHEQPIQPEVPSEHIDTIEIIEAPEEEDASPSGRLASLRDEMGTEPASSAEGREDRMRRFFGNE